MILNVLYAIVIQDIEECFMMRSPNQTPVLSVRISPSERDLLEQAAEQANTNLSDFVRRRALEAAEMEVLDHRVVTIPAENWEKFEAWTSAPPKAVPALRDLASIQPAWQD